jgi:excinuclease ABC subunit C
MENIENAFNVQAFLTTLTTRPGIYKMLDAAGEIIYIGKAKNLKNRVSSYFKTQTASIKQQTMVAKVAAIEVTVTHTEGEALLLECQLIKHYKPRYNICLRDDKSYPYIFLSTEQAFPQLTFHRGAKKKRGHYFGPYPSASAARESLKQLQKLFPVRQCDDTVYSNRTRPCLQYQIERCTAPCVGLIDQPSYAQDVDNTLLFLQGQSGQLIEQLIARMEQAASIQNYEKAAVYRDRIAKLRVILERNFVHGEKGDVDIIACASKAAIACIQVFFIRNGQHLGNQAFFPKMLDEHEPASILQAFIAQYYLGKQIPAEIIISHEPEDMTLLAEVLSNQAKHQVALSPRVRGERLKWLEMAKTNAENALASKLADKQGLYGRFLDLQALLGLAELPNRLECFDISHTQGDQTVAACVVFDRDGPLKSAYRRFNIEGITPGDDYAAMSQAVFRRFKRAQQENTANEPQPPASLRDSGNKWVIPEAMAQLPDILFIDGGKGQVNAAKMALAELNLNNVMIVGVSKGPDRKAGMEKLIVLDQDHPLAIQPGSSGLLLIQHIRDEAHRFAITGHRQRRSKAKQKSILETIPGLGAKRRQLLLKQFGGLQGVSQASVEALCKTEGVSRQLAQRIYELFHHQDGYSI